MADRGVRLDELEFDGGGRRTPTLPGVILLAGWGTLAALFAFDAFVVAPEAPIDVGRTRPGILFGDWDPTRMDWLSLAAAVLAVAAVAPSLADPTRLRARLAAYPSSVVARGALVVCLVTLVAGVVGPTLVAQPTTDLQDTDQPPVGTTVAESVAGDCVGGVSDGQCRGSLAYPLGTTPGGADVLAWMLYGARTVVQFALVSAAIMAPIGVAVGVTAGYVGGWVDTLLSGYVDIQQTVPTVIIYVLAAAVSKPDLFVLVLVYGLFDWGSIARVVRARTIEQCEEAYVEAAESAGAGPIHVVRHHLLANVADTAVTAVSLQLPKLVMVEIALSFVSLGGEGSYSWGQLLQRGLQFQLGGGTPPYSFTGNFRTFWWLTLVPAVATLLVVTATSVTGDALQRVVDPTDEG